MPILKAEYRRTEAGLARRTAVPGSTGTGIQVPLKLLFLLRSLASDTTPNRAPEFIINGTESSLQTPAPFLPLVYSPRGT